MPRTRYASYVPTPRVPDEKTHIRTKQSPIGKRAKLEARDTPPRISHHTPDSGAVCGATKYDTGKCQMPAGWGTSHTGQGRCRMHGGADPRVARRNSPAARRARLRAATKGAEDQQEILQGTVVVETPRLKPNHELNQMLGYAVEIDPLTALLWCIRITAGEVQYWTRKLATLNEEDLFVKTIGGPQLNPVARQRQAAVDRLAKYSQVAINSGLAERAVRMAEAYGELLANLLYNVVTDLEQHLPADVRLHFRKKAEIIIPQRLYELEEMQPQVESVEVIQR
jgi:hypothetical protein